MTREEKVAEAQRLRGAGLKFREIAEEMGYAISTVQAWIKDPDRSVEIARKNSYRGTCQDCGAPTNGCNGRDLAPSRCLGCERTKNADRNSQILKLHEEGLPHWLIAEELGMSPSNVSGLVQYYRRRKGMDISLHRLGGGEVARAARRRQMVAWRREGFTNEQIAERLGTSKGSVSTMFVNCRRLGLDVPPAPLPPRVVPVKATPEQLEELWAEGLTLAQIADFCGYAGASSVSAVIATLRRRGRNFPGRRASYAEAAA